MKNALLFLVIALLTSPFTVAYSATDAEVAELRAMILELKQEVEGLKSQLTEKEAKRDVSLPPKTESDSPVRQPIKKPAVAGVSSKYGLSFYGYFKLDGFYDSGLTSHQEIPFWAVPSTGTAKGSYDMTAKETRLGMNFSGPEVAGGKVTGKLEMDFYGNINSGANLGTNHAFEPRTRHVYLNWDFDDWSILAGKTWEPYIITIPQTLNFSYYNLMGQLGLRKTQLRVTKKLGSDVELVGAVLEPVGLIHGGDIDGDTQDDGTDSEFPVLSTKLLYKQAVLTDKPATFGLAGVFGQEQLDIHGSGDGKKTYDAYAVQGGFTFPITDSLTWKSNFFYGINLDSFWGGIGQGINTTLEREIESRGGWTQLQFKATDAIDINVGYSIDDPKDGDLNNGMRSKNQSYLLNAYYHFDPSLTLGLEYFRNETDYKNASDASNDRIMSSIIFKF